MVDKGRGGLKTTNIHPAEESRRLFLPTFFRPLSRTLIRTHTYTKTPCVREKSFAPDFNVLVVDAAAADDSGQCGRNTCFAPLEDRSGGGWSTV